MLLTVVVPVYNAEHFVREAVESALTQPETGEVVLVEDASVDNSLDVCRTLDEESAKVRLLRHSDAKNHGAGSSRNLGIVEARYDHIAFLDADDYYLPGRFSVAAKMLQTDPGVEGVYEAVGYHFESEAAIQRWQKRGSKELITMTERVGANDLFATLGPIGRSGFFHTDGLVVTRSALERAGFFDEQLRLHQDTALFVKLAAVSKLEAGRLDRAVAKRRLHDNNRYGMPRPPAQAYAQRLLMWTTLWHWGKRNLNSAQQQLVVKRMVEFASCPYVVGPSRVKDRVQSIYQLTSLLRQQPELLTRRFFLHKYLSSFLPWPGASSAKSSYDTI